MNDLSGLPQPVFSRRFGQGPRAGLAIHCTIAHSGAWRGLAAALDDLSCLTVFDMLSHGRSPDWDGQGDFQDRNVAAAEPLLNGAMDLIGHSFGATVALRLAVAHPERVRSLTLIEPVFFAVAQQDEPDVLARHLDEIRPFADALSRGEPALAARLFNRMWSTADSPRWPDLPESTRAAMTRSIRVVPACDPSLFGDRAGLLAPGVLDRVTMPTLLLRGADTPPVIRAIHDGLARRLPNAESAVITGAGHMAPITHPGAVAAHVRALMARAG